MAAKERKNHKGRRNHGGGTIRQACAAVARRCPANVDGRLLLSSSVIPTPLRLKKPTPRRSQRSGVEIIARLAPEHRPSVIPPCMHRELNTLSGCCFFWS